MVHQTHHTVPDASSKMKSFGYRFGLIVCWICYTTANLKAIHTNVGMN